MSETLRSPIEVVDRREVADLLGYTPGWITALCTRGVLPADAVTARGRPLWFRETVLEFARRRGRVSVPAQREDLT